jgi:hypothetical protein
MLCRTNPATCSATEKRKAEPVKRSPHGLGIVTVAFLGVVFAALYLLGLRGQLNRVQARLHLLQACQVNRNMSQVKSALGEPSSIHQNELVAGEKVSTLWIYKSNPKRPNGLMDVWVTFDTNGSVQSMYLPEDQPDSVVVGAIPVK